MSPRWGNEGCQTALTAVLAPSQSPGQRDHPSPSQTWLSRHLLHIPRARTGSCTWHMTMTRILIICRMQNNQLLNRNEPCCSLHQRCTQTALHIQNLFTFLTWHRLTDDSIEVTIGSSYCPPLSRAAPLLPQGLPYPCTPGRKTSVSRFSWHMPREGPQGAPVQTLKLMMDISLWHHWKGEHLLSLSISIILQISPAFCSSCKVIWTITTLYELLKLMCILLSCWKLWVRQQAEETTPPALTSEQRQRRTTQPSLGQLKGL